MKTTHCVTYIVVAKETCARCGGTGWVEHPEWTEYYAAWDAAWERGDQLRYTDWFRARGYKSEDSIPPEEIPCPDCKGFGEIRREVSLEEALEALGVKPR